jgi:hypothetical protein
MIIVLSPAKSLDFTTPPTVATHTQPDFLDQSQVLVERLRPLSPLAISELMGVSDALATLNAERYASWHPALYAREREAGGPRLQRRRLRRTGRADACRRPRSTSRRTMCASSPASTACCARST